MIDNQSEFGHSLRMSHSVRKFIAVLLAIWLPLFSGSALTAGVSMQMPHDACHEMEAMQGDHHDVEADQAPAHDQSCCNALCHLACSGYLAVQQISTLDLPNPDASVTPYLFSYHSVTSIPLLPPPLV